MHAFPPTPLSRRAFAAVALLLARLALAALFAALLGATAAHADAIYDEPGAVQPMPLYYPKDPALKVELLAQKFFGPGDVAAFAGTGPGGMAPAAGTDPFGSQTRVVTALRLDHAGPVNITLAFLGETRTPATKPPGRVSMSYAFVWANGNASGWKDLVDSDNYTQRLYRAPLSRSTVPPAWQLTGHAFDVVALPGGEPVTLYVALRGAPQFHVQQVRVSVLRGEFALQSHSRKTRIRAWLQGWTVTGTERLGVLAFALLLVALLAREKRRDEPVEDPPRILGLVVGLLGLASCGATLFELGLRSAPPEVLLVGPSMYFVVVGSLWMLSGLYLFMGRPAGQRWYAASVLVVWVWTNFEFVPSQRPYWAQLLLPTLLGAYVLSRGVSRRLER
ncbi:hypothetical protein BH11PSE7_BH11PSE7_25410 [soil metagenome]